MSFGVDAIMSGSGVQTTPFFTKDGEDSLFYYLNLEGVSIGNTLIKFATKSYPSNASDNDYIYR